jgi:preprotein translocase subunit SecF
MFVVNYRKFFYGLSTVLILASIVAMFIWGFNLGIDFKGGSIIEVEYSQGRPAQSDVQAKLAVLDLKESIRPTGDTGFIIRMKTIDQAEKGALMSVLNSYGTTTEKRFDSIGPVLGGEALRKSLVSIILVILAIVLFIAYAFRQVSEPVSSWKYGLIAIVALVHDVIIPAGVFVVLGHFLGYEIDTLFITALLVVLGFSVHDTIVVFDRVRENLKHANAKKPFNEIVGESISQTFTRSINTSLTTLLALIVLYFVGGSSTHHFSLALIIGIVAGTYSSIFIGSPLLVTVWKWQENKKQKGRK